MRYSIKHRYSIPYAIAAYIIRDGISIQRTPRTYLFRCNFYVNCLCVSTIYFVLGNKRQKKKKWKLIFTCRAILYINGNPVLNSLNKFLSRIDTYIDIPHGYCLHTSLHGKCRIIESIAWRLDVFCIVFSRANKFVCTLFHHVPFAGNIST